MKQWKQNIISAPRRVYDYTALDRLTLAAVIIAGAVVFFIKAAGF